MSILKIIQNLINKNNIDNRIENKLLYIYEKQLFGEIYDSKFDLYGNMADEDWNNIKYSKPNSTDNWKKPYEMKKVVVYLFDILRKKIGHPIEVISGKSGTHTSNSFHYNGLAMDLYCKNISLYEFYLIAELLPFTGVGIYPNMNTIHCDCGIKSKGRNRPARWIGMKHRKGKDKGKIDYFPMIPENIEKFILNKPENSIYL